jgi:cytochrome P450
MIAADPPGHTRLRTLVHKTLSRRMLEEQRSETVAIVEQLLQTLDGRHGIDFVEECSAPLLVDIITQILSIKTSMRSTFRRWSNNVTAGGNGQNLSEAQRQECRRDADDFRQYFIDRIAEARRRPQDNLISALVEAEEQGDQLNAEEVLALCVLLLIGGNETTTYMLANAFIALRDCPDQERLVRADRSLVRKLTEESVRFTSPIQVLFRRATADTEIAGVHIPRDAIVMPIFASANRAKAVFENPGRFGVTRPDLRRHMAFDCGIHLCVGRALALLEGELTLNMMFDRWRTLEVAESAIEWCDAFYLRGPKRLRMRRRCTGERNFRFRHRAARPRTAHGAGPTARADPAVRPALLRRTRHRRHAAQ